MSGSRFRQYLDNLYPEIPASARNDFRDYQRLAARRIALVVAIAVLVIAPVFQIYEYTSYAEHALIGHPNALWRLPVIILALIALGLRWRWPEGQWPRAVLLLMAFTLMVMQVGIFGATQALDGFPVRALHAAQGLIIVIAAVSVAATRGLRDVPVIYGLPLLALPAVLIYYGVPADALVNHLIYPVAMVVVACIVAEMLYQGNLAHFLSTRQLRQHAMIDPLTGLLNRRAMSEDLGAAHARAVRHGKAYALIMADLDRFKRVNDEHGHDVGDEVLVELARRLQQSVRVEDRVARWGGEEFLVLLQDTDEQSAFQVAEKLRRSVADMPFTVSAGELHITVSLGLALYREGVPVEAAVTRSDEALYRAKQNGRNRTEVG